jgi:glucose/mannose-6-phosphate isomerase
MGSLDDRAFVTRLDPKGMLVLAEQFADQCRRAIDIAKAASLPSLPNAPTLGMLTGLGGSASGGDFVRALFEAHGCIPFLVNRDYGLPTYVGQSTIVFCASYSGNTEETLSAYADAKSKGAFVILVTSGGKLKELGDAAGDPVIQIPGGQPPRTALGFMLMPVIVAAERFGLLPAQDYDALIASIQATIDRVGVSVPEAENPAKQLARQFHGAVPILYGLGGWPALAANRWRCQINENAKNLCFHHAYPELNHNEILGWVKADEQGVRRWTGAVLLQGGESAKMRTRLQVTEALIADKCTFTHVEAQGKNLLEKMLDLIVFGDFVSLYLAALNGVDPENIDAINHLKAELAKVE